MQGVCSAPLCARSPMVTTRSAPRRPNGTDKKETHTHTHTFRAPTLARSGSGIADRQGLAFNEGPVRRRGG
eukprot:12473656-Alexandrium_andersonii.AAC.1